MNKIPIILILLFSFITVQKVSAATLTWDEIPTVNPGYVFGDLNTDPAILTGMVGFQYSGNANHLWKFTVNPSAIVNSAISVLIGFNTSVSNVSINNQGLTNLGNGQWAGTFMLGAAPAVHELLLSGLSFISGSQYNISLKATVIPIPAAVWLFASGFAAVGFVRRKRQRGQQPV